MCIRIAKHMWRNREYYDSNILSLYQKTDVSGFISENYAAANDTSDLASTCTYIS